MNSNELKAVMVRKGITGQELAKGIGKSEQTTYAKINGEIDFKLSEVAQVIMFLGLTEEEAKTIFYPNVEYHSTEG